MLEKERQFYAANSKEWVQAHPGKFVLVKDETLVGVFNTIDEALAAGASKYGLSSFLVRQLGQDEQVVTIPALTLGLLRADP